MKVLILCPYCKNSYYKELSNKKEHGSLFSILIKDHEDCGPFIAFIDENGMHRGSQKIDHIDDSAKNERFISGALKTINELNEKMRFYHIKIPKKRHKQGFEHMVATVQDRPFMSSEVYKDLLNFLKVYREDNTFGMISLNSASDFDLDGALVYGKYFGMIYTLYWNDQTMLKRNSWEEIRAFTNLTIEKLIELYDLMDLFF
ncbi:MAG: hypothetical protein BAJALOKI1v1_50011 [Promethearchaeota archaeon]|nr:MAG: hypothetical protein BAJALOKI1v1_50011 [Candidatus Lokiarchaeota archaeon]